MSLNFIETQERSTLRHAILPIWYAGALGGLAASYVLIAQGSDIGPMAWIVTLGLSIPMLFVLELVGAAKFAGSLPPHTWRDRVRFLGQAVFCWLFSGIAIVLIGQSVGAAVLARVPLLIQLERWVRAWPLIARLLVPFLFLDLWSYGRHRIEHAGGERSGLWRRVHRWHHAPAEVSLWTGMTIHPVEVMFVFAVPSFLFGALGFAPWEVIFLFSVFLTITSPQHMNSGWTSGPLGFIICGPEAHTRHHSTHYEIRNANFGDCLTIWDRLFGTFVPNDGSVFGGPFGTD